MYQYEYDFRVHRFPIHCSVLTGIFGKIGTLPYLYFSLVHIHLQGLFFEVFLSSSPFHAAGLAVLQCDAARAQRKICLLRGISYLQRSHPTSHTHCALRDEHHGVRGGHAYLPEVGNDILWCVKRAVPSSYSWCDTAIRKRTATSHCGQVAGSCCGAA